MIFLEYLNKVRAIGGKPLYNYYIERIELNQLKNLTGQLLAEKPEEVKTELKEKIGDDSVLRSINNILEQLKQVPKDVNEKAISKWLIKNIIENHISLERIAEDVEQISNALKFYFVNKSIHFRGIKFDTITYKELKEKSNSLSSKDEKYNFASNEAKKIYEDARFEMWTPLTHTASCQLGRGTSWCTAADSSNGENYFKRYSSKSPLYILINKSTNEKWQFHENTKQYMDKNDVQISLSNVATKEDFSPEVVNILSEALSEEIYNINAIKNEKEKTKIILEKILDITNYKIEPDGIVINSSLNLSSR